MCMAIDSCREECWMKSPGLRLQNFQLSEGFLSGHSYGYLRDSVWYQPPMGTTANEIGIVTVCAEDGHPDLKTRWISALVQPREESV